MKVEIQAMNLEMTREEIERMIPPEKLVKLKGKSGIVQAYILAQEGKSQPKVLGKGAQILEWPRAVIKDLAKKVKSGTKFFINHGIDNSHNERNPVGEVLASAMKDIKGKLSNVVVGYFPEKETVKDLDICSMETNVVTSGENDSIVSDVDDISGVALGSSIENSPAFPGAKRLASIQCFQTQFNEGGGELPTPGEGAKKMTFEEIKKGIQELNIFPWQLFTEEQMRKDKVFGKVFEEKEGLEGKLKTTNEQLEKTKKESSDAIKTAQKASAKTRLKELLPEGLTEKQNKFIMDNFDPDKIEDLEDDGLKNYIDNSQKEYSKLAKMFGVSEEAEEENAGGENNNGKKTDPINDDPVAKALTELVE